MMCISLALGNPTVTKKVLATEEITDEEMLKEVLDMNSKELLNTIKRTNYVMLTDTWWKML